MSAANTQHLLCRAAAEVIAEQGAAHLTLSAVADRAGVSKGGLLYHYPNKRALLAGMLEHLLAKRAAPQTLASEGHIGAMLEEVIALDIDLAAEDRHAAQALLAVSAEDPELLAPARAYLASLVTTIDRHAQNPSQALTILLATEGLQLLETLGLLALTKVQRQRLIRHLRAAAAEEQA